MSVNVDEFKLGMRYFPAGVNVIATQSLAGVRAGLTATAVCSLSIEPPSLLVCVNKGSNSLNPIRDSKAFSVNMLSVDQVEISNRFATPMLLDEKFDVGRWNTLETGAPVLEGAVVVFDCELDQMLDLHTHSVLVGHVKAVSGLMEAGKPLLYMDGQYGAFSR